MQPPPDPQSNELMNYLMAYIIGFFSQLFRLLMGPSAKEQGPVRIISGAAGAGLASIVAVNIANGIAGGDAGEYAIAISGIVGWLGGNAMTAMAGSLEKRLGIDLKPDSAPIEVPVVHGNPSEPKGEPDGQVQDEEVEEEIQEPVVQTTKPAGRVIVASVAPETLPPDVDAPTMEQIERPKRKVRKKKLPVVDMSFEGDEHVSR